MAIYRPDIKIYYGEIAPENRLIPAPEIGISIDYSYSNDTFIGYTYVFNLTGAVTALDLRNLNYGDSYDNSTNYSIGSVVDHMHKLRSTLSQNGAIFKIVNGQTDEIILEARGGILRSFTFDESNNNWTHFANYSATLEFSSVDFMSATESCDNVFLDPLSFPKNKAGIVDINKFKIKSFSDNWSFTFNETEAYNRVKAIDSGTNLDLNNVTFNIEYSINAVGKHYHVNDNEDSKLLPAWEQAKNFVQYRLYNQVTNLLNNVLKNPYTTCSSSDGLDDVHVPGSNGLLSSLGDTSYKIYNEQITCESSESDGSFSATYSAIVRSTKGNQSWAHPSALHTVQKSIQTSTDSSTGKITKNISINGTIEGLIEGGLIRTNTVIQLPSQGSIVLLSSINQNKYDNAKLVLDKIYSDTDYNSGQGQCGKRDLKVNFKTALGITIAALQTSSNTNTPEPSPCPPGSSDQSCVIPDPPHPASFNLTHDYSNGTITYKADYNSDDANCPDGSNTKFSQISIQTTMPTKVIATFNIPNSDSCPVIQELGTYTTKTVSVTISGTDSSCQGKPKEVDFSTLVNCGECDSEGYFPVSLPLSSGNFIVTQKQYTSNPIDGSYTISLGYICNTSGCSI